VNELTNIHKAQVLNYLKATGIKLGVLVNFSRERNTVDIERIPNLIQESPCGGKIINNELERTLGVRSSSFMFVVFRLSDFKMRRKKCVYTFLYVKKQRTETN